MKSETVQMLTELKFEVQDTSFDHMKENENLSPLKSVSLPDNDAANILNFYPDLLVVSKTLEPERGIFFMAFDSTIKKGPKKAKKIYENYLPSKVAVVTTDAKNNLLAKWYHDSEEFIPLKTFLETKV